MLLSRTEWDENALQEFYAYEKTLAGDEKNRTWEQRIVGTALPCYARTSSKARLVAKEIKKGNFLSFLDGITVQSHFDSLVCCFLLNGVKDFDTFERYLTKLAPTFDNWASCDTLRFAKKDSEKLITLSEKFLQSNLPFVRRVGVNVYFELIKKEEHLEKAFSLLDSLANEKEYYVNMCAAWLLCECFARYRDKTLFYFQNNATNAFIVHKAVSKCRDSYRVGAEDKKLLLQFVHR